MTDERILLPAEDKGYFMRRAAQERSAADHASDDKARKAHQAMAERYQDLVHSAGEDNRPHAA